VSGAGRRVEQGDKSHETEDRARKKQGLIFQGTEHGKAVTSNDDEADDQAYDIAEKHLLHKRHLPSGDVNDDLHRRKEERG
jgi:hypothetical protein